MLRMPSCPPLMNIRQLTVMTEHKVLIADTECDTNWRHKTRGRERQSEYHANISIGSQKMTVTSSTTMPMSAWDSTPHAHVCVRFNTRAMPRHNWSRRTYLHDAWHCRVQSQVCKAWIVGPLSWKSHSFRVRNLTPPWLQVWEWRALASSGRDSLSPSAPCLLSHKSGSVRETANFPDHLGKGCEQGHSEIGQNRTWAFWMGEGMALIYYPQSCCSMLWAMTFEGVSEISGVLPMFWAFSQALRMVRHFADSKQNLAALAALVTVQFEQSFFLTSTVYYADLLCKQCAQQLVGSFLALARHVMFSQPLPPLLGSGSPQLGTADGPGWSI